MQHLVTVLRSFMMFHPGERFYVSDEFLRRYGRYLRVSSSRPYPELEDAVDAMEVTDGEGDHLQGEG